MDSHGIFTSTVSLLERSLDLRSVRHDAIVSNVANIDTPNYKAFDLMVKEELHRLEGDRESGIRPAATHPRHFPLQTDGGRDPQPVVRKPGTSVNLRGDGNTVDLDSEMAALSENQLLYDAAAQIIGRKFRSLKNAIRGGKQ